MAINYNILANQAALASDAQLKAHQAWQEQFYPKDNQMVAVTENEKKKRNIATAPPVAIVPPPEALPPVEAPGMTAEQMRQELINANKTAQLSQLQKSYNVGMGRLGQEGGAIAGTYRNARTGVGVQAQQNARSFNEYIAQRGLATSGAAEQGELSNNVALQQSKTNLYQAENAAVQDVERRKSDLEMGLQSDITSVESGAQAKSLEQKLAALDKAEAEAKANADKSFKTELDTIGRFYEDFTAEIQRRQATSDTKDDELIPWLEQARAEKVSNQNGAKADAQANAYETAMARWKLTGVVSQQDAAILGIPAGTPTSDYKFKAAELELDRYKASLSRSGGSGSGGSTGGVKTTSEADGKVTQSIDNLSNAEKERQLKSFVADILGAANGGSPSTALQSLMDNKDTILRLKSQDYYNDLEQQIRGIIETTMKNGQYSGMYR